MAEYLSEEEQLEVFKRWWKENGKSTIAVIALLGAGFFGWNQYQNHLERQAEKGSALYEQFLSATSEIDKAGAGESEEKPSEAELATVKALADDLQKEFPKSLYATFAQLYLAKMAVNNGDLDQAKTELEKVLAKAKTPALKELVQLRLARIELAAGRYDSALSALRTDASSAYASAYAELRGDIYLMQKQYDEARIAYQAALDSVSDPRSMHRSLVQLKLDNAAVAKDEAAVPKESAEPEASPSATTPAESAEDA